MAHDPGQELVDVIDDHGRIIAVVTRREMRERRLPHRCVYILVLNQRGELLVHLRTPTKDVFPSHWDVAVGGVLTAGESFDEGAAREVEEELGVTAALESLFPFQYADARTAVRSMAYRALHEGPFRFQPEEVVCGEFLPLERVAVRIRTEPFCPDGVAVLEQYQRWLSEHAR